MPQNICPDCGSELLRKNPRDGSGPFWGCSAWKQSGGCKFTREDKSVVRPISWKDSFNWGELDSTYLSIGSAPRFLDLKQIERAKAAPSKTILISRIDHKSSPSPFSLICHGVSKMLLRGEYAFPGFAVERELLGALPADVRPKALKESDPEIGYEELVEVTPQSVIQCLVEGCLGIGKGATLGHLAFDSEREASFFTKWIPKVLGAKAAALFTPQAPLDMLLNALGEEGVSFRRADFMFYVPGYPPCIIEIDGDEHQQKRRADAKRDAVLARHKISTIRVPNAEMDNLAGPNLEKIAGFCKGILEGFETEQSKLYVARALLDSSVCSQLQYALIHAVLTGFPVSKSGLVNVDVVVDGKALSSKLIQAAVEDLNTLLFHYSALFNAKGVKPLFFKLLDGSSKAKDALSINLQPNATPATLGEISAKSHITLCRAILPAELLPPVMAWLKKPSLSADREQASGHLTFFLNYLFRKREFRGQQLDAIVNVLSGKDTLVLQPTGAGKSLIYQLSGQLMPGVTIVIDPIKALIEDQVRGLKEHRISRAAGLMSSDNDPAELHRMMASIKANNVHYILMSPERLLIQSFRDSLSTLVRQTSVNLAVIDEAHCLSQWGHSFRFAYLRLAENLMKYCSDKVNGPPKLLALTGTASRTVLKEMVAEIGISLEDEGSIIKPATFNRKELQFSVVSSNGGGATFGELNNTLQSMPEKLGKDPQEFFLPNGRKTNSGIIFTPHARGESHGLVAIRDQISGDITKDVGVFASTVPSGYDFREWETVKSGHASAFKANEETVLIATNAFGMGVDKPNIRWTVHMGIPSSLEQFYQEAGRAGRDRNPSHCAVIYSETDENYTNKVLDPSNSIGRMRELHKDRKPADDVDRVLYFHLGAFSSVRDELKLIKMILDMVDHCSSSKTIELAYADNRTKLAGKVSKEDWERALVRMSYCALIEDYTTNYSAKTFTVTVSKYNFIKSKKKLERYIGKVQPAQLKVLSKRLAEVQALPIANQPALLCEVIIEFTYDIIERSRRRMILESVQMARNGTTDAQIRERLLNYLEEGASAARISELVDAPIIEFDEWFALIDEVSNRTEAKELRGDVSRMLESYPDHAGLLLTRSISEVLSGDGAKAVIRDNIKAAITSAINKYALTGEDMSEVFCSLLKRTNGAFSDVTEPLLEVFIEGHEDGSLFLSDRVIIEMLSVSESWGDELRNVALQFTTVLELEKAVPRLKAQADNIKKTIDGVRG